MSQFLLLPLVGLATGLLSAADYLPGSAESVGLSRLVPDRPMFHTNPIPNLDNWEPYVSVLGNSTFLIEANTFAEDGLFANQRFVLAFQPVSGGAAAFGEAFFGDDDTPYRGQVNASRQNGNPGRVAGDRRPGAVNFIAGGEASLHAFAEFRLDGRWDLGLDRGASDRYASVQTHTLNPSTLVQTPLSVAFDGVNSLVASGVSANQPEVSRFGGDVVGLENGNFLIVADDRSNLHAPERSATAAIVAPDGTVVKDTFQVAAGSIWANAVACQGGFCVRMNGVLYFYDTAGTFRGTADTVDASVRDSGGAVVFAFDRGRGDGTRLAGHINSPYVYLAGANNGQVRVAAWDSRTFDFVASTNVNELTAANGGGDAIDFQPILDRVNVGSDALNGVTVAFEFRNAELAQPQTGARVLKFDPGTRGFRYLTPSFFPFVNHGTVPSESGQSLRTFRPSVAMTTRQICFAAKGEINSSNNVAAGPDTLNFTTFYSVVCHPEPQADPTPGVGTFPGGVDTAGLGRIVPDTIIYGTNPIPNLDNWEPFTSVLGTGTFLIEANTFADDGQQANQRFVLAFQPAAGGSNALGEVFYADDDTPYRGQMNASRQNGNPGRVAGDKRPGATAFIAGGEASPHAFAEFRLDGRWDLGLDRGASDRYASVQTHTLDPVTLVQTPVSLAFDAVNSLVTSGAPANQPEVSRFGGDVVCLENGNFLIVADDRSNFHAPARSATATIVAPDGTVVKDTFQVAEGQIWANAVACQGGFCVRMNGVLYFYSTAGVLRGTADTVDANVRDAGGAVLFAFDRGRGDGTRMAAHINSPYVYLAGANSGQVRVAAWDSRTFDFVGSTNVNELTSTFGGGDAFDFQPTLERVNAASDALNNVTVVYEIRTAELTERQTAARVFAFNPATRTFKALTSTFLPFLNSGPAVSPGGASLRTFRPSVSMTTRQICIAAKGEINSMNDVAAGPDTLTFTTFYTVIDHPCPQADPTLPAGASGLRLSIARSGQTLTVSWTGGGSGPYTLQRKVRLTDAEWTDVETTSERSLTVPVAAGTAFFRIQE